jgi:hypothetical protein
MVKSASGALLTFGGGGPQILPGVGGFEIALDAVEGLHRQWARELGHHACGATSILPVAGLGGVATSFAHPLLGVRFH